MIDGKYDTESEGEEEESEYKDLESESKHDELRRKTQSSFHKQTDSFDSKALPNIRINKEKRVKLNRSFDHYSMKKRSDPAKSSTMDNMMSSGSV